MLLNTIFVINGFFGSHVRVGITSDDFAKRMRRSDKFVHLMLPFEKRKQTVETFLQERGCTTYTLMEINDRYGPALSLEEVEGIIVTEETYPTAVEINKLRTLKALDQLLILVVPS